MSRATLRRNGPRSGLSREASERSVLLAAVVGVSGVIFLGLEREEGEGEGGFLGSGDGDGVLALPGSDLWVGVSGRVIRGGGVSDGVFTRPGMVVNLMWKRE